MNTDLNTHRIEGYVPGHMEMLSVPLISHIQDNLWMGGCIEGVELPHEFRYVVSMYPWEKYALGPDTQREEVQMYDSSEMFEDKDIYLIAKQVCHKLELGQTLVHCQAGLNRSGLISATALVLNGMAPKDAIALLREKRSEMVLCNKTFEAWLLNQQKEA